MRFNPFQKKGTVIPVIPISGGIGMAMPLRSGIAPPATPSEVMP